MMWKVTKKVAKEWNENEDKILIEYYPHEGRDVVAFAK